jgi:RNA polymerase sigma-70 factor (ECF subfamily)
MNDETLLAQAAQGDEAAFAELVGRYQNKIFTLVYRFVPDADAAEDIAAEVFFRVWKYAARFNGDARFSTWCYRIAVNTCLNHRKAGRAAPVIEYLDRIFAGDDGDYTREFPEPPRAQPDVAAQSTERDTLIRQAVAALAPQQRMAFVLSWFEGNSYAEIAAIMELSVPAVESLLFRAKENLKKRLAPLRDQQII